MSHEARDHGSKEDSRVRAAPRAVGAGNQRPPAGAAAPRPGFTPAGRLLSDQQAGGAVRRGHGYTLRVSAVPAVHRQLLARCQPLDGGQGLPAVPAQRKARREYEKRVSARTH